MSYTGRANSRNSLKEGKNKNVSNSNLTKSERPRSEGVGKQTKDISNQKKSSSSTVKVLGQDAEVSVEELWDLSSQGPDRHTPLSNSSRVGSRAGSATPRRTPTPSKQISLQAVKRKEEKDEPFEKINWNDFDRPISISEERPVSPPEEDKSDSSNSPCDSALSAAEQLVLIEQRERELSSALSSHHLNKSEAEIDLKLNYIEEEREEKARKEKQEEERLLRKLENERVSENDGGMSFRNEHFRILSDRDTKNNIDTDYILGHHQREDASSSVVKVSQGPKAWLRDPTSQSLNNTVETLVAKQDDLTDIPSSSGKRISSAESESKKKNEAAGNADDTGDTSEDEDDDEDDENDLIGHKGKAPNHLLMEFVTCMMEEDYENAEKLCKMILIYEPNNPEALNFFPLIQEKRKQEEEEEDEDDSDDSDEDSDDSGDDSGEDEDDDDDDDDDDSEEDEDSDSNEESATAHNPDSGIASANSD